MPTLALSVDKLLGHFTGLTLQKGRAYFEAGKVIERGWQYPRLEGKVRGNYTYTVILVLDLAQSKIKSSHCSCPIGVACKHCAALLYAFISQNELSRAEYEELESDEEMVPRLTLYRADSSEPAQAGTDNYFPRAETKELEQKLKRLAPALEVRRSFERIADLCGVHSKSKPDIGSQHLVYVVNSGNSYPHVEVAVVQVKNGGYTPGRKVKIESVMQGRFDFATEADYRIADLWISVSRHHWNISDLSNALPETTTLLLERVIATGRCFFQNTKTRPLVLGAGLPGKIEWYKTNGGSFGLRLVVKSPEGKPCEITSWTMPWYLDSTTRSLGRVELPCEPQAWFAMRNMRTLAESELQTLPLLLADLGLADIIPPPPVAQPIQVKVLQPVPKLSLVMRKSVEQPKSSPVPVAVLSFDKVEEKVYEEDGNIIIQKNDSQAESNFSNRLFDMGFKNVEVNGRGVARSFSFDAPEQWQSFLGHNVTMLRSDGWEIPPSVESMLTPIDLSDDDLNFEVEEHDNWWFSLALNVMVDGKQVPLLPVLTAAVRQLSPGKKIAESVDELNQDGKFTAYLDNGRFIRLPFERVRSIILSLGELLDGNAKKLKLSVQEISDLYDETLGHNKWIGAESMKSLFARLKRLTQPVALVSPKTLCAELRPYQLEGVTWLQKLAREQFGGLLADDMGLGKTMQLLGHVCLEKENRRMRKPFLVICPTSVLPNWISEAGKFAPELKVLEFYGPDRWKPYKSGYFEQFDMVVTTYSLIGRDAEKMQRLTWHGIAIDEAQAIKNAKTEVARCIRSLKADHRFGLTGTPIENNLGELWSHFQFALPGLLGDEKTFNTHLRGPIEKGGDLSRKEVLAKRIRPFLLRRTKDQVASELPEKTVIVQQVELDDAQRDLYETVRLASTEQVKDEIAKKGFKHSQIVILDALLKLRQVCCDPRLVKLSAASKVKHSAKLDMLMEMVQQLIGDGRKILIFSQFTSMLDLIAEQLNTNDIRYVELRGDTRHRSIPIKQFQNGNYPVFLLSLKAGGVGLNLTAADVVIHYDPWWNPAVEDQATDRAHRIGQDKHVFVYKFIARGTIEQRMTQLQERKRALASGIYDEQTGLSSALTEQDLMALLAPIDSV